MKKKYPKTKCIFAGDDKLPNKSIQEIPDMSHIVDCLLLQSYAIALTI